MSKEHGFQLPKGTVFSKEDWRDYYHTLCEFKDRVLARKDKSVEVYSREECPFNYCDNPSLCKSMNLCRHKIIVTYFKEEEA